MGDEVGVGGAVGGELVLVLLLVAAAPLAAAGSCEGNGGDRGVRVPGESD